MNIILWVSGAMLAAVGLVQIIAWAVCRAGGAEKRAAAYKVVRLSGAGLEDQLQYELLLLHWNAPSRPEVLVLVDDGLSEEEKAFCRRMLCSFHSAILCAPEELADLVRLQDPMSIT